MSLVSCCQELNALITIAVVAGICIGLVVGYLLAQH